MSTKILAPFCKNCGSPRVALASNTLDIRTTDNWYQWQCATCDHWTPERRTTTEAAGDVDWR